MSHPSRRGEDAAPSVSAKRSSGDEALFSIIKHRRRLEPAEFAFDQLGEL